MEAVTSSYSATDDLLRYIYSVLLWRRIIRISNQGVYFMNFPSQIFFNFHFIWLWFLIAIMKRCAEQCTLQLYRTSLSIFILFQLQGWLILRVRTKFRNFHTKRVIMEIAMMKILNNCVSGRLINN